MDPDYLSPFNGTRQSSDNEIQERENEIESEHKEETRVTDVNNQSTKTGKKNRFKMPFGHHKVSIKFKNTTFWKKKGSFSYKIISPECTEWSLFELLADVVHIRKDAIFEVKAIHNPALTKEFRYLQKEFEYRMNSKLYQTNQNEWSEDRSFVYKKFLEKVSLCPLTKNASNTLVGLCGTDSAVAEKICESGFLRTASSDGWYGQGLYSSSSFMYTAPYWATKSKPCVILCWVLMGSPYPVTAIDSFNEKPIMDGYTSHYVLTNKQGYPPPTPLGQNNSANFDEMVVGSTSPTVTCICRKNQQKYGTNANGCIQTR